jgi:predicted HTH transcriptional regulator
MHLKKTILDGENEVIDFKKTIKDPQKIAKTLVAFANHKGGKLLVGVLDNGFIEGVKSEDEERYTLEQSAQHFCKPAVDIAFEEQWVDEKLILICEVFESDYALGLDDKWWAYIRVKDKSLLASKMVVDMLKKSSKEDPIVIEYSTKEKELLRYLSQNDRITLNEYCHIVNISKRRATKIMVNLVLSGIIRLHTTEKIEYYTAC